MRLLAPFAIALFALPLAGCSVTTTTICVDFVDYEDPAAAALDATVVVVGTVVGSAGQRSIYQEPAPVRRFAIEAVLKGDAPAEIDVASVPQTCNGEAGPFPDGDPLESDDRVQLFLSEENGEYRLITPWDGVVAAPEGQPLPWDPEG